MSNNISDIERKLIEKERECEKFKVRLRESQIECEIKKASLDYLSAKYHIDLKKASSRRMMDEPTVSFSCVTLLDGLNYYRY